MKVLTRGSLLKRSCRTQCGSRGVRPWRVESLELRLVLSFSEISGGDFFPGLSGVPSVWGDYHDAGWVDASIDSRVYQNNQGQVIHPSGEHFGIELYVLGRF